MSHDCTYCDETFDAESKHLKHLKKNHYDDLSAIDKRRVDSEFGSPEESRDWFPIIAGAAVVVILGAVLYFSVVASSGNGSVNTDGEIQPNFGAAHDHASWSVTIEGNTIDFSQDQYQLAHDYVHFEGGDGSTIHLHATQVTIEYALEVHGFEADKNSLKYGDVQYNDSEEGTEVIYRVNGQEVDPTTYIIQDGDNVEIIVR